MTGIEITFTIVLRCRGYHVPWAYFANGMFCPLISIQPHALN